MDVTVFEDVYQRYATALFGYPLLLAEGIVQHSHGLSLVATQIHPLHWKPSAHPLTTL
jgi:hypothetical protein